MISTHMLMKMLFIGSKGTCPFGHPWKRTFHLLYSSFSRKCMIEYSDDYIPTVWIDGLMQTGGL